MTKTKLNKISISKDFIFVFSVLFLGLVLLTVIYGYLTYDSFLKNKKEGLKIQSGLISKSISDQFSYIDNLLFFIGKQIVDIDNKHPEEISRILMNNIFISDASISKLFSWTFLNWIDEQGSTHYSSTNGVVFFKDKPFDDNSANFKYYEKSKNKTWKMLLADPSRGEPANQWLLNAYYGLSNSNGKYLGSISLGLIIEQIVNRIESDLTSSDVDYYVIDDKGKLFFHSPRLSGNYIVEDKIDKHLIQNINEERIYNINYEVDEIRLENIQKIPGQRLFVLTGYNMNRIYSEIYDEVVSKISGFFIYGVIVLVVFYIFRNMIIIPILDLSNKAEKISNGDLSLSFSSYNIKELNILSTQLKKLVTYITERNETKQKLIESSANLEKANSIIIENNKNLEQKVIERTTDLEEALAIRTEIMNNLSHEVKTPIQGITGISKGLVEKWDELSAKERKDYAYKVAKSSERLFSLVSNLLDFSNLGKREIVVFREYLDIKDVIKAIIDECELLYIGEKSIKISSEIKEGVNSKTLFDFNRISQVLRNLISNSIKYTNEGYIKVEVSNDKQNNIVVSVSDSGVGIPEAELESIFKEFYQSSITKSGAGGSGLGLAISKGIIEAHNGKIWAANSNDGAVISFSIPLSIVKADSNHNVKKSAKPKEIVVIDDEEIAHLSIELMLSGRNDNIKYFFSPLKAIEHIKNNKVDIVLLDLMMPEISGKEVIEELHKSEILQNIKVLVQSGKMVRFNFENSHYPNIKFISKPYTKEELNSNIDEMID